ncbi:hypothetical protein B0T25DRAFT_609931 [Lasiosphaeria hispida]|uniref:Uncharacterized protein n=1 Tax=Lasiosphaeria hispida TaxID=260671 RepID=A0AAJ0MC62_9PEZI|nr:hypothetical protein B0T25DRAFT_609931 [Lasiosphaeria hispida]
MQDRIPGAHVADPDAAPRPELSVDDALVPVDPDLHATTSGFRTPTVVGTDIAWLVEAGFVDVVEKEMLPGMLMNGWPDDPEHKMMGKYCHADLARSFDSTGRFLKLAGLPQDEIEDLTAKAKIDLENPNIRAYYPIYVVYGRKPFEGEV